MSEHGANEGMEALLTKAAELVARLPGPVRRIVLRGPDHEVEIEWPQADGGPSAPAAAPGHRARLEDRVVPGDRTVPETQMGPADPAARGDRAVPEDLAAAQAAARSAEDPLHVVRAPLVGTFYRAPQPGAPPFVEVGDTVEEGQTLAIVEAMKLMNTIVADQPGRVVEICAADAEPVEFEQPLLRLAPQTGGQAA